MSKEPGLSEESSSFPSNVDAMPGALWAFRGARRRADPGRASEGSDIAPYLVIGAGYDRAMTSGPDLRVLVVTDPPGAGNTSVAGARSENAERDD